MNSRTRKSGGHAYLPSPPWDAALRPPCRKLVWLPKGGEQRSPRLQSAPTQHTAALWGSSSPAHSVAIWGSPGGTNGAINWQPMGLWEIRSHCSFNPVNFGVVCYTAIINNGPFLFSLSLSNALRQSFLFYESTLTSQSRSPSSIYLSALPFSAHCLDSTPKLIHRFRQDPPWQGRRGTGRRAYQRRQRKQTYSLKDNINKSCHYYQTGEGMENLWASGDLDLSLLPCKRELSCPSDGLLSISVSSFRALLSAIIVFLCTCGLWPSGYLFACFLPPASLTIGCKPQLPRCLSVLLSQGFHHLEADSVCSRGS